MYQNEMEFNSLLDLFKKLSPRAQIMEIGSLHGETLCRWLASMDAAGVALSIDLLVPPQDPRYQAQKLGHEITWPGWASDNGIRFYCMNSDSKDPVAVKMSREIFSELDFLFIDGGHDYQTCLADWNNYSPLVRKGGIVAFHDLGHEWPEVRKVWEQVRVGKESLEFVESASQYGIGVLYV